MTELSQDAPNQDRILLRNLWCRRTLFVLIFSRVATVLAVGLFVTGAAIYFSNFNFGIGGDARGAVMLFAGLCLALAALIGDLCGILAAWVTWRSSGSRWWLVIATVLPALEVVATALLWCSM